MSPCRVLVLSQIAVEARSPLSYIAAKRVPKRLTSCNEYGVMVWH